MRSCLHKGLKKDRNLQNDFFHLQMTVEIDVFCMSI